MKVCREWEREPKFCKSCKEKYAAKEIACSQCGKYFRISTGLQLKCKERGWDLPTRCEECKHDALLIKGAIGALRDQFPFALEDTIEKRGIIFTDKVAIVRSRKTGETLAEVTMDTEGIIFTKRVAKAVDVKTCKELNQTREGREGIIFTKRTADSYSSKTGEKTHRTKMEQKGVIFSKHYAARA